MADRRTALVTGATGGLGSAIVRSLVDAGHDIALHHRDSGDLARDLSADVVARGGRAVTVQADLAAADVEGVCRDLLDETCRRLGTPDVAVLNAGAQTLAAWEAADAAVWDALYAATLRHTAVLLRQVADRMAATAPDRHPVVVLVGSIEGYRAAPGHAAYATYKAAVHHLTAAAAQELGSKGIRVVGVAPGLVDRPGLARDWPEGYSRWSAASALGRPVTAAEVAAVVSFLASTAASGTTGITVPVDAGWGCAPGW